MYMICANCWFMRSRAFERALLDAVAEAAGGVLRQFGLRGASCWRTPP
jgi:hypothetical protein